MTPWLTVSPGEEVKLPPCGAFPAQKHVYEEASIDAINAALGAQRPLLVRGEPGTGKSQLARAAAQSLGRPLLSRVIDARSSAQDLLWSLDAVARLAEAQLCGALSACAGRSEDELRGRLREERFVKPAVLWWALDWGSARQQAELVGMAVPPTREGWTEAEGTVVLLDEIDKADSDLPNGLLEILGDGAFTPPGAIGRVCASGGVPLVVVTTNEERALPDAFVRRCLVLHLRLPRDEKELRTWLVARGRAHFERASEELCGLAADLLAQDRAQAIQRHLSPPGQAEYLDLIRAILARAPSDPRRQLELLRRIADFALKKHPLDSDA